MSNDLSGTSPAALIPIFDVRREQVDWDRQITACVARLHTIAGTAPDAPDRPGGGMHRIPPTPAGSLVRNGVVLLTDGSRAFVKIDRMMSYARLVAKLERYDAYRNAL